MIKEVANQERKFRSQSYKRQLNMAQGILIMPVNVIQINIP